MQKVDASCSSAAPRPATRRASCNQPTTLGCAALCMQPDSTRSYRTKAVAIIAHVPAAESPDRLRVTHSVRANKIVCTPSLRNSKGLGGKLRETELRGPNCERHKESSRPPRDHSRTGSDPIHNEEIERLLESRLRARRTGAGAGQPPHAVDESSTTSSFFTSRTGRERGNNNLKACPRRPRGSP